VAGTDPQGLEEKDDVAQVRALDLRDLYFHSLWFSIKSGSLVTYTKKTKINEKLDSISNTGLCYIKGGVCYFCLRTALLQHKTYH